MDHLSEQTFSLFTDHLFRHPRNPSTRLQNFTCELLLSDNDEISKLWSNKALRYGYGNLEYCITWLREQGKREAVGNVIDAFSDSDERVDHCKLLLQAVEIMINSGEYKGGQLEEFKEVKSDLEAIMVFAKMGLKCHLAAEEHGKELEQLLVSLS